jgi:DNA/RNA endonuclease YhcR with UshA esterase domain
MDIEMLMDLEETFSGEPEFTQDENGWTFKQGGMSLTISRDFGTVTVVKPDGARQVRTLNKQERIAFRMGMRKLKQKVSKNGTSNSRNMDFGSNRSSGSKSNDLIF